MCLSVKALIIIITIFKFLTVYTNCVGVVRLLIGISMMIKGWVRMKEDNR